MIDAQTNTLKRKQTFPAASKPGSAGNNYSFIQGEFAITVMSDGFITVPIDIVAPEGSPEQRAEILSRTGDAKAGLVESKTNIPVIRRGNDLIIVDIGAGDKYQPSDGRLSENLKASGIDAGAITKVVFTHAHPDHVWGTLTTDGSLRFPNATYYIGAAEWDFWMDPDYRNNMPSVLHEFADGAQRDLGAIKDRVVMLKPGDDIVTGLTAIDTAGHTPGHLSLEMAGGEGLIITADAATNEIASFQHPKAKFGYDTIPDLAIRNRARLIERAAADRTKLLGYHWTHPGVGFAEREGNGFRYVPVSS
jgi:glyoxylase-like metal-dependent hydrolase (beta-lactamase superfamily II)